MNCKTLALATLTSLTLAAPAAYAVDGDAAKGEKLFKRCSACHKVGDGAKNAVGPILTGVVGRAAASVPDYKYGKSIVAAAEKGLTWDDESITAYLENPRNFLRKFLDDKKAKSKMSFKLKKEQDRADVIAYLATFSE